MSTSVKKSGGKKVNVKNRKPNKTVIVGKAVTLLGMLPEYSLMRLHFEVIHSDEEAEISSDEEMDAVMDEYDVSREDMIAELAERAIETVDYVWWRDISEVKKALKDPKSLQWFLIDWGKFD